jgi:SAM-dependent methyltransferase
MTDLLEHWRSLNRRHDLSGVGQSGLPHAMNRWLYRAQLRQVRRLLDDLDIRPATVYDVGAGTGYWTSFWRHRGAHVSGCDFAPEATERLGEGFELLDISAQRPAGAYELVWVVNVLLHVLDEERFAAALANVAGAVQANGFLIMLEPLQTAAFRPPAGDVYSTARPAEEYLEPLRKAGLTLVELRPATAVTTDPIEGSSRARYRAWRAMWLALKGPARLLPATGWLMGLVAYLLDPIVLHIAGGATSKLVVLRRADPAQAHPIGLL